MVSYCISKMSYVFENYFSFLSIIVFRHISNFRGGHSLQCLRDHEVPVNPTCKALVDLSLTQHQILDLYNLTYLSDSCKQNAFMITILFNSYH